MKEQIEQEKVVTDQEKVFKRLVEDVTKNHSRIIDDWCKAYLAHLVKEGIELTPECLILFHKQPSPTKGDFIHEYWFETKIKQESANDKLLKHVMGQLHKMIVYVDDQLLQCRGKTEKMKEILILDEISNFLNFVEKE